MRHLLQAAIGMLGMTAAGVLFAGCVASSARTSAPLATTPQAILLFPTPTVHSSSVGDNGLAKMSTPTWVSTPTPVPRSTPLPTPTPLPVFKDLPPSACDRIYRFVHRHPQMLWETPIWSSLDDGRYAITLPVTLSGNNLWVALGCEQNAFSLLNLIREDGERLIPLVITFTLEGGISGIGYYDADNVIVDGRCERGGEKMHACHVWWYEPSYIHVQGASFQVYEGEMLSFLTFSTNTKTSSIRVTSHLTTTIQGEGMAESKTQ